MEGVYELTDLLNELSDDNRQLKKLLKENNEKFGKCWDRIYSLEKENEQLRKKLECCEYEHFLNELDEIHEKIDKGDLSDFSPLKEDKPLNDYNPLKEKNTHKAMQHILLK